MRRATCPRCGQQHCPWTGKEFFCTNPACGHRWTVERPVTRPPSLASELLAVRLMFRRDVAAIMGRNGRGAA